MKKTLFPLAILLLLFSSLPAQEYSFTYDGIERTYRVFVPEAYVPGEDHPMVINMHGLGSSAIEQQIYSGFDFIADTAGIVMVYPNGVDNTWNVFSTGGTDDVGFLSALIDTMAANYDIDLTRVYSTGMSMGGFMSYRLACQLEDRITAIASVTGLLVFSPCEPSRPVPVLQMHGTADQVVPYAGVQFTIGHWTNHNNCPSDSVVTDLPDTDTTDQTTVTLTTYGLCDDSSEVLLYTINGGEHTWPGATLSIGITNYDINGSAEIWNFFRKYTLDEFTGIQPLSLTQRRLIIKPMPVTGTSVVEVPGGYMHDRIFRLYDLSGKLMREEHHGRKGEITFTKDNLKSGLYILEITSGNKIYREKVLVY